MPTLEEFKDTEWYKERPEVIKELICQFPHACSVVIKATCQNAYVYSWFEDCTIKVVIDPDDNPDVSNATDETYCVFGYKPDDLVFVKENPELFIGPE